MYVFFIYPSQEGFPTLTEWAMHVYDHPDTYTSDERKTAEQVVERQKEMVLAGAWGKTPDRAELDWRGFCGKDTERFS
jgi:hypothetical protein